MTACIVIFLKSQVTQTGVIRGVATDPDGVPLPGVSVTLKGPALLGHLGDTTKGDGSFRIVTVPPGRDYVLEAELQGFQSVRREGIIVNVGMTVTLQIVMNPAALKEDVTVIAASPTVDVAQSKIVQILSTETFERLPLARTNIIAALQIAPGVSERSIHGSSRSDHGYMLDGIQMNDPDQNFSYPELIWYVVEEVELITGGASAEAFNAIGGFVNIVTKSGSNKFTGTAQLYYTNEKLTEILIPTETLNTLGIAKPAAPISDLDTSLTIGGPVIKDKIWFIGSLGYQFNKSRFDFRPTTILGKRYDSYDREATAWLVFGKLSFQILKNLRNFTMIHYRYDDVPHYYSGWWRTNEANKHNTPKRFNYSTNFTWIVDPNTIFDARFGGLWFKWTGTYTPGTNPDSPYFIDSYTGYAWGSSNLAEFTYKIVTFGSAKISHFRNNFLGGNHEFKAGVEVQRNRGDWGFYRPNPMYWYYYNQNPYYYRGLYGLTGAHPIYGDGWLQFYAIGAKERDSYRTGVNWRMGGFIQDSIVIKNKFTLNIGARFDYYKAWVPALTKEAAGTSLARALGQTYFVPTYGFNPYEKLQYDKWEDAFPYKFLSPHVGISYDLFGNGKTAAKATWVRQSEGLPTGMYSGRHPISPRAYNFRWWDLNGNGSPDLPGIDRYEHFGASPLEMLSTAYLSAIDPDIKIPYEDQFTLSLEHELISDFKIGLTYYIKDRKNLISMVLYDLGSGRYWNTYEKALEWWIPFKTIIPSYGGFPAQEVTVYFQSKNAPAEFYRVTNVPEGKMKYEAVEFAFTKRMTKGWQLGGSVVFSKLKGNFPISTGTQYTFSAFQNPNFFINRYGDLPLSRPLMVKLFGTFTLPYNFIASFFYTHTSGSPWGRTVTVAPPAGWSAANNAKTWSYSINVEAPGTRWTQNIDNLDLRLEKEFNLGKGGRLNFFVDIFNLFGRIEIFTTSDPGGTWKPADVNTTAGTFSPGWTGITGHSGQRIFKFSIKYNF